MQVYALNLILHMVFGGGSLVLWGCLFGIGRCVFGTFGYLFGIWGCVLCIRGCIFGILGSVFGIGQLRQIW